jgi:putative transposase
LKKSYSTVSGPPHHALTTALNEYIRWYKTERISTKLKGLSAVQYGAQALAD